MDLWNQCVQDARRLANWYNRFGQHDWAELHSAALFGLVQGIRWIEEGRADESLLDGDKEEHYKAYVLSTIHRFVRDHIREGYLIRVPHQAATKYMKAGEEYKIPLIFTASQNEKDPINLKNTKHSQDLDFEDLCSVFTNDERQIVDWMMCSYTYREMSKMSGVSFKTIGRRVEKIREKLRNEFDYINLKGKDSDVSTDTETR